MDDRKNGIRKKHQFVLKQYDPHYSNSTLNSILVHIWQNAPNTNTCLQIS